MKVRVEEAVQPVQLAEKPKRKLAKSDTSLPSLLSFKRCFDIVDVALHAERSDRGALERCEIEVVDHGFLTTKSYDTSRSAGDTQRSGDDSSNLIAGQQARLPQDFDVLCATLVMRIGAIPSEPNSCSSDAWYRAMREQVELLKKDAVIQLLSRYYAYNIANASWTWRNRTVSDNIEVSIEFAGERIVIPEALDLHIHPVLPAGAAEPDPHQGLTAIDSLSEAIANALSGRTRPLRIKAVARLQMLPGQPVWPSQRYMPEKRIVGHRVNGKAIYSARDFYQVGGRAAITAEKVGNALRTFDRDHAHPVFPDAIIPIEANGSSLKLGINLRRNGNDIRSLLPRFAGLPGPVQSSPQQRLTDREKLYVAACVVRGGIFGGAKEADVVPVETEVLEKG